MPKRTADTVAVQCTADTPFRTVVWLSCVLSSARCRQQSNSFVLKPEKTKMANHYYVLGKKKKWKIKHPVLSAPAPPTSALAVNDPIAIVHITILCGFMFSRLSLFQWNVSTHSQSAIILGRDSQHKYWNVNWPSSSALLSQEIASNAARTRNENNETKNEKKKTPNRKLSSTEELEEE